MDEHLPAMESIYSCYCSNFPLATKFYTEISRIAPYRSLHNPTLTNHVTLNRSSSTGLNRDLATSSMSLRAPMTPTQSIRASVRHSKLFESPLKLIKTITPTSRVGVPTRNRKKASAVPKKIRRRHSGHFRDIDDIASLSDSSSSSDELKTPTHFKEPIKSPVKKSLSSHDCHGVASLQVEFLRQRMTNATRSLNPPLPQPAPEAAGAADEINIILI